jgi:hypothetical protein
LYCKLALALHHVGYFREAAFRYLKCRNAILGISLRFAEASYLSAHLLAHREAGGIILRSVYPQSSGEPFQTLAHGRVVLV